MPVELSVEIGLNVKLPQSAALQAEMLAAMRKSVAAVTRRARANLSGRFLKVRSGRGVASLRSKIVSRPDQTVATIGSPLFYLRILHTGFPGQTLTVRQGKKPFTFFSGGHVIRLASIQHPGVSPRPWLQTAVNESMDEILGAFNQAVGRAMTSPSAAPPVAAAS